jgi:hypothetical protein
MLIATIDTLPPCRLVETGEEFGPLCFLLLNQNALIQTLVPPAMVLGKVTSTFVRLTLPSNCHDEISLGGVAPTKLKSDAPVTPGGFPRFALEEVSCNLIFTVHALTETISKPGAALGTGTGVGAERTLSLRANFCAFVTEAVPSMSFAKRRATSAKASDYSLAKSLICKKPRPTRSGLFCAP